MYHTAHTSAVPAFDAGHFRRSAGTAPAPTGVPEADAPADGRVCADRVLFEEKAPLGSLFVVHLGEFFRVLGGRTDRMETSLRLMGETLLKKRLEGSDTLAFHPEGFFVVRLNGVDRRAARRRAEAMTDDLGVRAVGERFHSWRHIREAETANDDWAGRGAAPAEDDDDWGLGHRERLHAYAFAAAQ